jgi:uncharacterized membrane protein
MGPKAFEFHGRQARARIVPERPHGRFVTFPGELIAYLCLAIALPQLPKLKVDRYGPDNPEGEQANFRLSLSFLPFVIGASIFVAVFVGSVTVYGRLSGEHDLIALTVALVVGILESAVLYFTLVDRDWWRRIRLRRERAREGERNENASDRHGFNW